MKKIIMVLMAMMILTTGAVFADELNEETLVDDIVLEEVEDIIEDIIIVDEEADLEEVIEEMDEALLEDEMLDEQMEESYKGYKTFKDEFLKLTEERLESHNLRGENKVKTTTIKVLKRKAELSGQNYKLEVAKVLEREIKVIHSMNDRIIDEKANLWDRFEDQVNDGSFEKAENTLKKIVLLKTLINENLDHIQDYLDLEIKILN